MSHLQASSTHLPNFAWVKYVSAYVDEHKKEGGYQPSSHWKAQA